MAILIHARLEACSGDRVLYGFESDQRVSTVAIPVDSPNDYELADPAQRFAAERVVARASSVYRESGAWPDGFTIAS